MRVPNPSSEGTKHEWELRQTTTFNPARQYQGQLEPPKVGLKAQ